MKNRLFLVMVIVLSNLFTNKLSFEMENLKAKHVVRTGSIELNSSIEEVFPLFNPVEERKWAEDWKPDFIFPLNQEVKEEMIFSCRHTEDYLTYWVIADYKPEEYYIRYINFTYDYRVVVLKIKCNRISSDKTEAIITYSFTGLSERGNEYIDRMTDVYYKDFISHWKLYINEYLSKK